jgi:DNA-binding transcriptional regulator YiaG
MTRDELLALQRRLGVSNRQLAELCGRSHHTIVNWRCGHTPVPSYVETMLVGAVITSSGTIIRPSLRNLTKKP